MSTESDPPMDPLTKLLMENPNCKVTISSGTKRRPREGDVRFLADGTAEVRKQETSGGCYIVNRGRPVYDWFEATAADIAAAEDPQTYQCVVSDRRPGARARGST